MSTQPEALRLAALLDATHFSQYAHPAAAELRRLAEVEAQRDALLALLGRIREWHHLMDAAIAAAEGEKHGQA